MARKYSKRRRYSRKKKTYRRKKPRFPMTKRLPFPNTRAFKTRYFESNITVTSVSGIPNGHVWRINNLNDVDSTGVGHQPIGRDQMALLYNRFRVTGARFTIRAENNALVPMIVVLHQRKDGATVSDVGELIENGNCKYMTLAGIGNTGSQKTLTQYFSAKKFFGKGWMDDDKASLFGSGPSYPAPSDMCYQHVVVQPTDDSTGGTVRFIVTIDFQCRVFEPVVLGQS